MSKRRESISGIRAVARAAYAAGLVATDPAVTDPGLAYRYHEERGDQGALGRIIQGYLRLIPEVDGVILAENGDYLQCEDGTFLAFD